MNVERIVQIHIATLAIIGAMLLALGEQESVMPALVVFAAIASVIFTDVLQWFRLNRMIANFAALLALSASIGDYMQPRGQQGQLLAIANLLIYLQIVLFFQRKSHRIYWHLSVLSLLQVVVAAALNVGFEFGILLMIYIGVAISTLTFFFVHRETSRVTATTAKKSKRPLSGETNGQPLWELEMEAGPITAAETTRRQLNQQLLGWGFLKQIAAMGAMTVLFTTVLFFAAPRPNSRASGNRGTEVQNLVGFSNEVSLNEIGKVLQSYDPIMRISFRELESGEPYKVYGDPYLRGSVLTYYEAENGQSKWHRRGFVARPSDVIEAADLFQPELEPVIDIWKQKKPDYRPLPNVPKDIFAVRQDIALQPFDLPVLFSVFPAFQVEGTPKEIRVERHTGQMYRMSRYNFRRRGEYRYSIATTAFLGGLQTDVTPHINRVASPTAYWQLELEKRECLQFDESRFPTLKATADAIVADLRGRPNRTAIARALRNHFHKPNTYQYTLDFRNRPPRGEQDPIEQFVASYRKGHCEYFASALVMMLRSQGIPARMVVGFKGGEFNSLGNFYQVRQMHAHAWVEAFLEPADVQDEVPPGSDTSPIGGWLRLDPTPGSDIDAADQVEVSLIDRIDDVLDYAQLLWSDYIVGMSARRQRESIYDPMSDGADLAVWAEFLKKLSAQQGRGLNPLRQAWQNYSWAFLLAALVILLTTAASLRRRGSQGTTVPSVIRTLRARLTRQPAPAYPTKSHRAIGFYEHFEKVVARRGLSRRPTQTARDFAREVREYLTNLTDDPVVIDSPRSVVNAFYRVRFGETSLSSEDAATVDDAIALMEKSLAPETAS